jgi:hypothetical protein
MTSLRLYTTPRDDVDFDLVRQFVIDADAADLFTESLTFEAKEKRHGFNIAESVASLSNTDGGIILVGVRDRGASGEARIVGVSQAEHDALVSHLHSTLPNAMPEIIPVAISGTDRLIIVVRVDADAVLHPVTVNGRFMYRLPGQNTPADRQRILDLVARDSAVRQSQTGPMQIITPSWRPQDIALWPERDKEPNDSGDLGVLPAAVSAELRTVGGLTLPARILARPWLDSTAKQAAADVLNNAPIRNSPSWALQAWRIDHARSSELRFSADLDPGRVVHAEARARVRLAGRNLAVLLGFRWFKVDGEPFRLDIHTFHDALLASMVTVASTSAHIAKNLGAAEPAEPRQWEAWLTSTSDNDLNVVDISRFSRDNPGNSARAIFPPIKTPANNLNQLDRAARDLLTYWLLEIGARNFENSLAAKSVPDWLRWPELA